MFISKLALLFSILIVLGNCVFLGDAIVANTQNGQVEGSEFLTVGERLPFYAFRGIPYAQPPVGSLRFEAPVPVSNWGGVKAATEDGAICVQQSPIIGSEDCLFVNVYTPKRPEPNCQNPLPTFVFIYGGGFEFGDSKYETYGPDYLVEKDVVVVTFNYRVGILGFASTGDSVVPGNNGLKDQLLALQWVQKNIRNFCGDPGQVTIGGQSAGSASVSYHVQSKKSKDLFHRAIMQSGTTLNLWTLSRNVPELLRRVATETNVDASNSQNLINGLKALNTSYLYETAVSVATSALLDFNPREGSMYGPVVEPAGPNAFFTEQSYEVLSRGDFNKVPVMLGFTSLEGYWNLDIVFRLYLIQYDRDHTKLLPIDMHVAENLKKDAAKKLKSHYFGLMPISLSDETLMSFLSDDQFVRAIREYARVIQKQNVPTYLYRFSYEGGLWGLANRTKPGVTHGEDLGYYWRTPHAPASDHDLVVRSRVVSMWTSFIKHGNPTPSVNALTQNVIWTSQANDKIHYLDIGANLNVGEEPEKKNMDVWDQLYASYGNRPYDTY